MKSIWMYQYFMIIVFFRLKSERRNNGRFQRSRLKVIGDYAKIAKVSGSRTVDYGQSNAKNVILGELGLSRVLFVNVALSSRNTRIVFHNYIGYH